MTEEAPDFKIGDEVELIKPHTFQGKLYTNEAIVGSRGVVRYVHEDQDKPISIDWGKHPNGFDGFRSSAVDPECLAYLAQPLTDEEMAEVYESFGVKP